VRNRVVVIITAVVWGVLAASAVAAPSVNVSVSSSEEVLGIGQTRTFSVVVGVTYPAGSLDGIFTYKT